MYKIKIFLTTAAFILSMFVVHAQTPGGVNNANYTWQVWLTPDSYSDGVWTNKITSTGTAGEFYAPLIKPSKVNRGYNFHPSVEFTKSSNTNASKRLITRGNVAMPQNQNVTSIFVYKRANTTYYDYLFSFNNGDANGDLVFYTNNSNNLRLYWPTTNRGTLLTAYEGMIAIDNANAPLLEVKSYLNGVQQSSINLGTGTGTGNIPNYNSPWTIGANGSTAASGYGFEGVIQEVIILKATGTGNHIEAVDLQKIHTYLALKYGISMNTSNYMASDGTVLWDNTVNAGYNNHIFGIGRDDASGLHQKQSVSTTNRQMTLFLGNELKSLNSENTSTVLNDKQSLIIGSDGKALISRDTILDGTLYENGSIDVSTGLNYRSNIYKAQLTGLASITVNLKVSMDFRYVLVSQDPTFLQATTRIYPISPNKIATIVIDDTHKYIRCAGYDAGPGGINAGLRLWLHADDEGALETSILPITDSKLNGFPSGDSIETAVLEWKDQIRDQSYSYASGGTASTHRIPVYEPDNMMMNYHPSVRFWSYNTNYAFLGNTKGIIPEYNNSGQTRQHTTYFVTSNDFNTNPWFYAMMFGSATSGSYSGPGYGAHRLGTNTAPGNLVGRFRTNNWQGSGVANLFNIGATSILGFYHKDTNVKFRFNGKEDIVSNTSFGNFNMNAGSIIGSGYTYDRTILGVMSEVIIFDRELNSDEQRRLESYMAIKYGATLRPANTATNRFNYTLSDGTIFWHGDVQPDNAVLGKYATFYNNIAAVIRDDAARLHNAQSHSTDAGSILHMGVGTRLGKNFDIDELTKDLQVVSWGSNNETGVSTVPELPDECADFDHIFNKKWMIHKQTENNDSITMLVGAQNNSDNVLGKNVSVGDSALYAGLSPINNVYMIVADSPEKLDPSNPNFRDFKAVVPMTYTGGEQQCAYTFTDSIAYVTFAYKRSLRKGCFGDEIFYPKTFSWNKWTRQNYALNGVGVKTISKTAEDLGDNIRVSTEVIYDNGARSDANYPRFINSPVGSALEIQRRSGSSENKVTVIIKFSSPVIPSFLISGLDRRSGQRDQVTITGTCPNNNVAYPQFGKLPIRDERRRTYSIKDNTVTVNLTQNRSVAATNYEGLVAVGFQGGVTEVKIEYVAIRSSNTSAAQGIFISPITINSTQSDPNRINEDGISFAQTAIHTDINTCETAEYRFVINNTNMESKYMNFKDSLPDGLKWVNAFFMGDANDIANNPSIKFNSYAGTNILEIDSIFVPCADEVELWATAQPGRNVQSGTYSNRATAIYERVLNSERKLVDYSSNYAAVDITLSDRKDSLDLKAIASPTAYAANREILVTLELTNPNSETITDMFLDLDWDAGFRYVAGSWNGAAGSVPTNSGDETTMAIAGNTAGTAGFTIPGNSTTTFTFKLLAPDTGNLEHELDEEGHPTKDIAALNISYEFNSQMDDLCLLQIVSELSGVLRMPYGSKNFIITNKHVTTKISK